MTITDYTFTPVADPTNSPPRWELTFTVEATSPTDITSNNWYIFRIDTSTGEKTPLREGQPVTLTASTGDDYTATIYDYESPWNTFVGFEVQDESGTSVVSFNPFGELTPSPMRTWLIHPVVPELSQPIELISEDEIELPIEQAVFAPLLRPRKVVVNSGQRTAGEGAWTFQVTSYANLREIEELLSDGTPLLMQIPEHSGLPESGYYAYLAIGSVKKKNISGSRQLPYYNVVIPYVEVDRPEGVGQSLRTWSDVIAEATDWINVAAQRDDWQDVLDPTFGVG